MRDNVPTLFVYPTRICLCYVYYYICIILPIRSKSAVKRAPNLSRKKKKKVQFEYTKKYTFDRETTKKVDHFVNIIIYY